MGPYDQAEHQAINTRIRNGIPGWAPGESGDLPDFCNDPDAALEALHMVRGEGLVEIGMEAGGWYVRIRGGDLQIWAEGRAPTQALAICRTVAQALDRLGRST